MYRYAQFIDNAWTDEAGTTFATQNPAMPSQTVGTYASASPGDIAQAASRAAEAQRAWGARTPVERAGVVKAFLDAVEARVEDLARSITLEQGKPLHEARAEIGKSLREARAMAGEAMRAQGQVAASQRPGVRNLVLRRPRGVIAAITPWNFPVLTPMRKIAPALVFGNSIVVKPSEFTPAAVCLMAEVAAETLPAGIFQVVHGDWQVGDSLVRRPEVAGVSFTGSVRAGREIMRAAADNLAEVSLEMGGKNAVIIDEVDDLASCLDQVVGAAFMTAGQRCTAISRVLVASRLENAVIDGLVDRAGKQVLGDGMVEGTTLGPLTNAAQRDRVESLVRQGTEDGARIAIGGERARVNDLDDGYFYQPTVLADVARENTAAREEIFGPVLTVSAYDDLDQAFGQLNDVAYGLTSALFARDNAVVQRFLDESQNGMLHVNHGTIPDDHMPFGGIKASGVGAYSVGPSAINLYTTEHSAYIKFA